jgi:glycosyltransferase involved in cell wall biosynthesis
MSPRARGSVLVIAGYAPSLINFRGPLLRAMRAAGCEVVAAAPELERDEAAAALKAMGIRCREVPLSRTGLNPVADFRSLGALVRLIRRERPEVVLAYTMKAVIFGLIAAGIAGARRRYALITGVGYAFTGQAAGRRGLVQAVSRTLYRIALKRADKLFFQNSDDATLFRELGLVPPATPVVIVNGSGVDIDQFAVAPLPPGPTRFLLIARLLTTKGIREYAEAAVAIRAAHAQVEFHLVGGTDPNPDAIALDEVQAWHDAGTLVWHGEVRDVRPYIAACHVYVLPSYREGTPRSVLEAMAMGRPIITSDAPGCRETVVHGDNGFLVPPRSVGPLAEAMERFISRPELIGDMGRRSRAIAEAKYDVRLVNAQMLKEMELT